MNQVLYVIGLRDCSYRAKQAYISWIKRYVHFHNVPHPSETMSGACRRMGAPEVEALLTHLAVKGNVAASTRNCTLNALLFLCRRVLHQDLGPVDALRTRRPKCLPTVLTKEELLRLISCLSGTHLLMANLIYGSGTCLTECLCLRVKELEFDPRALIARERKGAWDRLSAVSPAQRHLPRIRYRCQPSSGAERTARLT